MEALWYLLYRCLNMTSLYHAALCSSQQEEGKPTIPYGKLFKTCQVKRKKGGGGDRKEIAELYIQSNTKFK